MLLLSQHAKQEREPQLFQGHGGRATICCSHEDPSEAEALKSPSSLVETGTNEVSCIEENPFLLGNNHLKGFSSFFSLLATRLII